MMPCLLRGPCSRRAGFFWEFQAMMRGENLEIPFTAEVRTEEVRTEDKSPEP